MQQRVKARKGKIWFIFHNILGLSVIMQNLVVQKCNFQFSHASFFEACCSSGFSSNAGSMPVACQDFTLKYTNYSPNIHTKSKHPVQKFNTKSCKGGIQASGLRNGRRKQQKEEGKGDACCRFLTPLGVDLSIYDKRR